MASKTRKIAFYQLSLEKEELLFGTNTAKRTQLTPLEIEMHFKRNIYERMQELTDGHKAKTVEVSNARYVIEVITYEDHFAFLKIGQQNPANTVALRDQTTLETESVPMGENQLLELFTFCLIDFNTGIVSYIGINGAPRISAIRYLFNQTDNPSESITAHLAAIMTNDILQVLVRKHIISKLTVSVAIPEDEILTNIGLDRNSFDSIRNLRTRTVTYKLVGRRNKNIFSSSNKLAELIASIKTKYGDNLKSITANAKDFGEKSQSYDLLQYSFTKTVVLGTEDSSLISFDDFKFALTNTYEAYKEELIRFSRM